MTHTTARFVRVLMEGLIDDAGLFPPAALDMDAAVADYARHAASCDGWALGRFVVPVSRLGEFERAYSHLSSKPTCLHDLRALGFLE